MSDLVTGNNVKALKEKLEGLLLTQIVESVDEDKIVLKNGLVLTTYQSDWDMDASSSADFRLLDENFQVAITAVDVDTRFTSDSDTDYSHVTVTILHNGAGIVSMEGKSDSGSLGYYFSTLSMRVETIAGEKIDDFVLVSTEYGDYPMPDEAQKVRIYD